MLWIDILRLLVTHLSRVDNDWCLILWNRNRLNLLLLLILLEVGENVLLDHHWNRLDDWLWSVLWLLSNDVNLVKRSDSVTEVVHQSTDSVFHCAVEHHHLVSDL